MSEGSDGIEQYSNDGRGFFQDTLATIGTLGKAYFGAKQAKYDVATANKVASVAGDMADKERASRDTIVKWFAGATVVGVIGLFIAKKFSR